MRLDVLADAVRVLRSRPGRTAAMVTATGLATGLLVATLALSATAAAQVTGQFDARRNREVTLRSTDPDAVPADAEPRALRVAGVRAAGVLHDADVHGVTAGVGREPVELPVVGASPGLLTTVRAEVTWQPGHPARLGRGEALVGAGPAEALALAPPGRPSWVFVDGIPFAVAGVLRGVARAHELVTGLVIPRAEATPLGGSARIELLVETVPGAAPQVARQLPVAVHPTGPERFDLVAPPDPRGLRAAIESDVRTTMLALASVVALVSLAGVASTMSMSVVERTAELGLRRALGATPGGIAAQITVEAAATGLVGGIVGLAGALATVLAVTIAQHWQPVLDPRVVPLALVVGVSTGVVGGCGAARRAGRIEPAQALRR